MKKLCYMILQMTHNPQRIEVQPFFVLNYELFLSVGDLSGSNTFDIVNLRIIFFSGATKSVFCDGRSQGRPCQEELVNDVEVGSCSIFRLHFKRHRNCSFVLIMI